MDLIDKIREISAKVPKLKEQGLIRTEEGTKNALVMPFINALGYDVFNPTEVTPELDADVGVKKGEKVDYAIKRDGKPIMLFECKNFGVDLKHEHASQLYRYFSVTAARFGILTDGVIYRFYTDLVEPNKMDADPFFVFDLTDPREAQVEELKKFSKSAFDEQKIITTASELKYKGLIKNYLAEQLKFPTEGFVRLALSESKAYTGRFTQTVIDEMRPIVQESLRLFVNAQVEERLKTALAGEAVPPAPTSAEAEAAAAADQPAGQQAIVTTQDELDAYYIIKSILREVIDVKRVTMRDAQSYCSILLDDNIRRIVCRLRFNTAQKFMGILTPQKEEHKVPVNTLDDLYSYANELKAIALHYVGPDGKAGATP